ncbi:MAG: hypothetical protein AYK18_03840 [Theionarchaea archaeon DG-70]|nr:MAG: hypothetical protein AYK18_03840 [Theionarchaea archaeon DG-70]
MISQFFVTLCHFWKITSNYTSNNLISLIQKIRKGKLDSFDKSAENQQYIGYDKTQLGQTMRYPSYIAIENSNANQE